MHCNAPDRYDKHDKQLRRAALDCSRAVARLAVAMASVVVELYANNKDDCDVVMSCCALMRFQFSASVDSTQRRETICLHD